MNENKEIICEHCGCSDWYAYDTICVGCYSKRPRLEVDNDEPSESEHISWNGDE